MQTKHYVALALVIGLAIGIGGWLVLAPKSAVAPTSQTASTTVTDLGGGNSITTTGSSTITVINEQQGASKPPAVPSITFSANVPTDAKAALQVQYNTYAAQLKTAPTRVDLWLQLGVVYKIAGDYQGAITAWTYVAHSASSPSDYVAYGDLGDLYLNFTHEYAKAEASYKTALVLKPNDADYTAGLKAAQQAQGK
jgi:hypothetical protein